MKYDSSFELEIKKIVNSLYNGKIIILSLTTVATILSLLYGIYSIPYYQAVITLYPAKNSDSAPFSQFQSIAQTFGIGDYNNQNFNIVDIINSKKLKLKIIQNKWITNKFEEKVDLIQFFRIKAKDGNPNVEIENALKKLSKLISVKENKMTGLITITVIMPEKQLAADVANFFSIALVDYLQNEQQNKSKENRIFIEKRLNVIKVELAEREDQLRRFLENNNNVNFSPLLMLEAERLKRAVEIKNQIYITLEQQKELALIDEVKNKPTINILDTALKPEQKIKPKKAKIIVVTFFLTFIMSCIIALYSKEINIIVKRLKEGL